MRTSRWARSAVLTGISLLALGAPLIVGVGAAFAAGTAPAWEPDVNAAAPYGNISFYNANGDQVTSGTNLASPFAYAVADAAADALATNGNLAFANPTHGESPSLWTSSYAAGPTAFSPSISGAPADIAAFAPTYPVVAVGSSASITSWLTTNTPDTTTGYANTVEVRLTDSGPGRHGNPTGTYWESDIGYNTTSSPITVDGTTVPANGWALLFPFVTPSTVSLTTSATGGHLNNGTAITLTATASVSEAGDAVQFFDNGTYIPGSLTTNPGPSGPGSATFIFSYTPPSNSTNVYTADFVPGDAPGDETGAGTTSATIVGGSVAPGVTVQDTPPQTETSTVLAASSNSVADGAPDTFTGTVGATDNSTTGVTGSVEFLDGTTAITGCTAQATTVTGSGTAGSPGVGTATCTTSSLLQGSDSITAVFTPTSNSYATSTSSAVLVTVAQTGTTTTLSASSNSVAAGASGTFTASVGATDNSTTGVTGSVEFLDGTTAITGCTAQATTVTGSGTAGSPGVGTATCITSSLLQGSDSITAVFTPTSNLYATSTSSAVLVAVAQTGTTTTLSARSAKISYGASDTFTAGVGATDNSTTGVTGSVEFLDGTTAITGCTAQATTVTGSGTTGSPGVGTATCATTSLPTGSDSVTAAFTPTNNSYETSTSSAVGVEVGEAATKTALNLSSSWVTYGDEGVEILSVSVLPEFAGSTPSGTVKVSESGSTLCAIPLSGAKGSCTLSGTQLGVGSYYGLTASYAGSTDFAGSFASTTESLTVASASSTTTLSRSAAKVVYGHEGTEKLSVSVRPEFSDSRLTGIVMVRASSTTLCAITLLGEAGSCTLSARDLPVGGYGLVATYSGSLDFESSASANEGLTVSKATSKIALKLSPSKVTFGHEASEHISVNVSPEFAGSVPDGKVTVKISSRTLCVISLSSSGMGSCTLSAKKLSVGTYGVVANYSGSRDFNTSASTKETLAVVE